MYFFISLSSIGLVDEEVSIDDLKSVENLFAIVVPSAVFVAVMALQLKYFGLRMSPEQRARRQLRQLGGARHRRLSFLQEEDLQAFDDVVDQPFHKQLEAIKEDVEALEVISDKKRTDMSKISPEEARCKHIQEMIEKYWNVAYTTIDNVTELFWRLLEVYLPKAIIFLLFAAIIDKISASNFLVLVILVVTIPIEVNSVTYLILTGLISCLAVLKMLYQLALVDEGFFRFSDSCLVSVHSTYVLQNVYFKPQKMFCF